MLIRNNFLLSKLPKGELPFEVPIIISVKYLVILTRDGQVI